MSPGGSIRTGLNQLDCESKPGRRLGQSWDLNIFLHTVKLGGEVSVASTSLSTLLARSDQSERKRESPQPLPAMAFASSSVISSFLCNSRSKELIFSSKSSSSVLTGRRAFGSIRAAQVSSQANPRRRNQNVEGDIYVGK